MKDCALGFKPLLAMLRCCNYREMLLFTENIYGRTARQISKKVSLNYGSLHEAIFTSRSTNLWETPLACQKAFLK